VSADVVSLASLVPNEKGLLPVLLGTEAAGLVPKEKAVAVADGLETAATV
jgi:hypothetical protein